MELHSNLSKHNAVLWRLALQQRQKPVPLLEEFKRTLRAACDTLAVHRTSIWLYRQQESVLECALLFEQSTEQFARGTVLKKAEHPAYFAACASEKYIDAGDAQLDSRTKELSTVYLLPNNIRAMLDAPIFVGTQQKGVLCFELRDSTRQWQDEDRAFASSIADLVALAIAEEDSSQAQSFIESAMDSAAEAIFVVTTQGEIRRTNRIATDLFDLSPKQFRYPHINNILPGLMNGTDGLLDQVMQSPVANITRKTADYFTATAKQERTIPVTFSISKIKHWRGDHALIILQDNSEKFAKDQQIKNSEALYRTVVEDQPDLIIRTDAKGAITFANNSTLAYANLKLEQIVGTSVYDYAPVGDHDIIRKAISELSLSNPVTRYSHTVVASNGSQHIIAWVLRAFYDNHQQATAYQAIGRDITREREAEEKLHLSQRLEAIAVLAGGLAHDFNNLLTPILSFTDLAKTTLPQDAPQVNYLNYVMTAANRAKELAKMVLIFSRRDQRQEIELLAAGSLLREIVGFFKKVADSKIQIIDHIDLDLGMIEAHPSMLYQIVSNLFTNAIQSMPAGGVLRFTATACDWSQQRAIQIEVKDTGSGIPPAILEHIFEPFFTTKQQGTGLGLSVVKGLVDELGGEIHCKSELNIGTSFVITLPVVENVVRTPPVGAAPYLLSGQEKILVIDDEESIVLTIRDGLQHLGYKVETRISANAAIAEFAQHSQQYNLLITDCTMPLMSGFELSRQMRQINPNVPIILMSGYGQAIDSTDLAGNRINNFIQKPFVIDELAAVIRKTLRH